MNASIVTSLLAVCAVLGLLGGCASAPDSQLVNRPPPPAPTATPGMAAPAQPVYVAQPRQMMVDVNGYIVTQAPPAPQIEAVPDRPSPQHVWVLGHWMWQNNRYAWMAGHWEVPPTTASVWVAPRWEPEGGAIRFYEGYWK